MSLEMNNLNSTRTREDISDYVAHLQVHMSLQSRNLLPHIGKAQDNSNNLLYQTQVNIEKLTSREIV